MRYKIEMPPKEELEYLYLELKASANKIKNRYGVKNHTTVIQWLRFYKIPVRRDGRKPKHGMNQCREWYAWNHMKRRCHNPNYRYYGDYGGRGIIVCERWLNAFENFFLDMGPVPGNEYSLDRIDVNKSYTPDNCKWSTPKEQANNRRKRRTGYTRKAK